MQRICFTLTLHPDAVPEYRRRHAAVWPEMRAALQAAGWSNYSIFVSDAGQVVGYLETDDFDAARARMADSEVNARWQREMQQLFADLGGQAPDEAMTPIPEAFHLD